ncbi:methylenetetrahydrofolate reductase [Helicobacter canadensis]|uniref:Methylenetetrahydrofolate reductase n=1 Tax=Helicobacter canadensis MIT 98-5491 TaxID=537970 RepID=C5ZXT4_9HELI|nr:methylenetetrahydrofolate reductase [Helicobacter canadensis]EES89952.1 methylenetetrahydrofolate reductase [Helicobacter canadensis MIT 98-5491]EFR49100.1 methylenetetrahydrofolate reductase (NAD(P)H) [Helicobacter canadensis MIT 98-5491]STP02549.1 methylenetetrahydrofolate reductase [Helicobacter canadensis]
MNKIETFIETLRSHKKCFTYEFSSPASFSLEALFETIKKENLPAKIDAFVCTDSPLAKLKHNAILASLKLQNTFEIPSITTMSMRDRNTLALQSELIGMNSLDLRLILALTGDPIRHGNQPQAKGIFEGNSNVLLKTICQLNTAKDINNNPIQGDFKPFYPFSVLNSYSNKKQNLYKKMQEKIQNGALAIFTQPIYDLEIAEELLQWSNQINQECNTHCVLIFGFFPITSYKTALFLHNKLPGVFVPQGYLESMEKASQKGMEFEIGLQKSQELFNHLCKIHNKIHLMSANKADIIGKILNG